MSQFYSILDDEADLAEVPPPVGEAPPPTPPIPSRRSSLGQQRLSLGDGKKKKNKKGKRERDGKKGKSSSAVSKRRNEGMDLFYEYVWFEGGTVIISRC